MRTTLSLLAQCAADARDMVPLREMPSPKSSIGATALLFACLCLARTASAYTVVILSSASPESVEQSFIASTTNQYQSLLIPNPFASNTATIRLFGPNPNYNAPPPPPTTLQQALSLGTTLYFYGWADGESYQQYQDYSRSLNYFDLCSSPTVFAACGSTATWDMNTCQTVANMVAQQIYLLHSTTPTVVPGNFQ